MPLVAQGINLGLGPRGVLLCGRNLVRIFGNASFKLLDNDRFVLHHLVNVLLRCIQVTDLVLVQRHGPLQFVQFTLQGNHLVGTLCNVGFQFLNLYVKARYGTHE